MSWFKKLKKQSVSGAAGDGQPKLQNLNNFQQNSNVDTNICYDVFKSHWLQVMNVIEENMKQPVSNKTKSKEVETKNGESISTVQNLLQYMVYLLVEEQSKKELLGPVLEYAVTEDVFNKLLVWCEVTLTHSNDILISLLKMYEVLISQAQGSLLHHKQVVKPLMRLLSIETDFNNEEIDSHRVMVLNLLCVWMNRDSTLLEVFFHSADAEQGPAKFLIFSLLIQYIHCEGTVGQQARDALLLVMSLSSQQVNIANYIVDNSNFACVLATGLSGLYSTLPRHIDIKADDWHCLQKADWAKVPELTNFLNSFEFCNSVIEVAHSIISDQLINFIHNGFLVSVFGPSLHKTSVSEVIVTTAYLNLFLTSVTAQPLIKCFLNFILTHSHEGSLIINTLVQRMNSSNRLSLVSLSLIRTLIDLNCEDLMLQLVFKYLIPCQHIMASQRKSINDVDLYNSSAFRFLQLTSGLKLFQEDESSKKRKEEDLMKPTNHKLSEDQQQKNQKQNEMMSKQPSDAPQSSSSANSIYTINEDLSVTIDMVAGDQKAVNINAMLDESSASLNTSISSLNTMAEFGPDLTSQMKLFTSYMDYLEDSRYNIMRCMKSCESWVGDYDGVNPPIPQQDDYKENVKQELNNKEQRSISLPVPSSASSVEDTKLSRALSATQQMLNLTNMINSIPSKVEPSKSEYYTIVCNVPESSSDDEKNSPGIGEKSLESQVRSKEGGEGRSEVARVEENKEVEIEVNLEENDTTEVNNSLEKSNSLKENKSLEENVNLEENNCLEDDRSLNGSHDSLEDTIEIDEQTDKHNDSTVDEFFTSLMKMVPKHAMAKIEENDVKIKDNDEDFESGIELSNDGDKSSPEKTVDQTEDFNAYDVSVSELDDCQLPEEASGCHGDDLSIASSSFYDVVGDSNHYFEDGINMSDISYQPSEPVVEKESDVIQIEPIRTQAIPFTGPLLVTLFGKLDQMVSNTLYENLLLTGVISRLACYHQPLLRSFLLNTRVVFHPNVRSLYQVLTNVRNKLAAYQSQVADFHILVGRAQKYLLARGCLPQHMQELARNHSPVVQRPMPVPRVKTRVIGDILRRKNRKSKNSNPSLSHGKNSSFSSRIEGFLETGLNKKTRRSQSRNSNIVPAVQSTSTFYVQGQDKSSNSNEKRKNKEMTTKNAVYATIIFSEFLKELSAISQEHAIVSSELKRIKL